MVCFALAANASQTIPSGPERQQQHDGVHQHHQASTRHIHLCHVLPNPHSSAHGLLRTRSASASQTIRSGSERQRQHVGVHQHHHALTQLKLVTETAPTLRTWHAPQRACIRISCQYTLSNLSAMLTACHSAVELSQVRCLCALQDSLQGFGSLRRSDSCTSKMIARTG